MPDEIELIIRMECDFFSLQASVFRTLHRTTSDLSYDSSAIPPATTLTVSVRITHGA